MTGLSPLGGGLGWGGTPVIFFLVSSGALGASGLPWGLLGKWAFLTRGVPKLEYFKITKKAAAPAHTVCP